jgi:hypothetical protein
VLSWLATADGDAQRRLRSTLLRLQGMLPQQQTRAVDINGG